MKRLVSFIVFTIGLFFIVTDSINATDSMNEVTNEQAQTPFGYAYVRLVQVRDAAELQNSLTNAQPGDFIQLADGVYRGNFRATVSATADRPIMLYGSRLAILEGESTSKGYGFYLKADYWTIGGITVRNSLKGIITERANFNTIVGVEVHQIGDEGVHFRSFSSDNILRDSWIYDTGLQNPKFGEAVYVGSAISNWWAHSDGNPDKSDRNQIIANLLGPNVSAESIDIKEGTTGGVVSDNRFISTETLVVDSWVDVKGNDYNIINNVGFYEDGSQFRIAVDIVVIKKGWGLNNNIVNNTATVANDAALPTPPSVALAMLATPQPAQTAVTLATAEPTFISQIVPPTSTPLPLVADEVSTTSAPTVVASTAAELATITPFTTSEAASLAAVPTHLPLPTLTPAPVEITGVNARLVVPSPVNVNDDFNVSVRLDHPDRAPGGGVKAVQIECRLSPQTHLLGSNARAGTHFGPNALIVNRNFPTSDWMLFVTTQSDNNPPVTNSGTVVKFTVTPVGQGQATITCNVDIIAADGNQYRLLTTPVVITIV